MGASQESRRRMRACGTPASGDDARKTENADSVCGACSRAMRLAPWTVRVAGCLALAGLLMASTATAWGTTLRASRWVGGTATRQWTAFAVSSPPWGRPTGRAGSSPASLEERLAASWGWGARAPVPRRGWAVGPISATTTTMVSSVVPETAHASSPKKVHPPRGPDQLATKIDQALNAPVRAAAGAARAVIVTAKGSGAAAGGQGQKQQAAAPVLEGVEVPAEGAWRPALPTLTAQEMAVLRSGQRVQRQVRDGGAGSGLVVVDVRADKDVVMGLLSSFDDYTEMMDTVRSSRVFPSQGDKTKVEFTLSRFRLLVHVVMTQLPGRDALEFELDPDCTKAGKAVLKEAKGFWFLESPSDRPAGYTRIWMSAKVEVNRFVPGAIVDYAAARALPRASTWLKPTCEAAQREKMRREARARRA